MYFVYFNQRQGGREGRMGKEVGGGEKEREKEIKATRKRMFS